MIVGISGKARSGKNQFSEYLREIFEKKYNRVFNPIAFADELKEMCMSHFGLSSDQLWGNDKEKMTSFDKNRNGYIGISSNPSDYWTAREIMQELGSFYRKIDYDFWVKRVDRTIKRTGWKDVIITDARHVNECEYVKSNGILIRVKRESADKIHGMDHESETSLDNTKNDYFDIDISNDGTLEDLYIAAENAAKAILMMEDIKRGRSYNGN